MNAAPCLFPDRLGQQRFGRAETPWDHDDRTPAIDTYGQRAEREVVSEVIAEGICNAMTLDDERVMGRHLLALHNAIHVMNDPAEDRRVRAVIAQFWVDLLQRVVNASIKAIDARALALADEARREAIDMARAASREGDDL
jgi:hypothetical protein